MPCGNLEIGEKIRNVNKVRISVCVGGEKTRKSYLSVLCLVLGMEWKDRQADRQRPFNIYSPTTFLNRMMRLIGALIPPNNNRLGHYKVIPVLKALNDRQHPPPTNRIFVVSILSFYVCLRTGCFRAISRPLHW